MAIGISWSMFTPDKLDDIGPSRVKLSVIMAVRNGEPYLGQQLASLANQECSFSWEMIVVDNASSDNSVQIVRDFEGSFPKLILVSETRQGKSFALNTGREFALGDQVVFVDADDETAPGYIESMAAALDEYEMVSARVDMGYFNPWDSGENRPSDELITYLDYRPYIMGALLGVRAESWRRIGDFDTTLSSAEDVDFTWRASELGISMGIAPGAVLRYRRPSAAWKNFLKARSYGRAHVWLYERHRRLGQPRRKIRPELRHIRDAIDEVIRHEDHWQWRAAWSIGLVEGRLEESLRRRVWFP